MVENSGKPGSCVPREKKERKNLKVENRNKPKSYKDLLIWQKGMALALYVYRVSVVFPADERFGLISQVRRAAISVPSNIAEGQARHTTKEFLQFLSHALGSLAELDTQLLLSVELGYVTRERITGGLRAIDELQKMIIALRKKLVSVWPLATRHSPLVSRPH
jgi:four helix bundle protein